MSPGGVNIEVSTPIDREPPHELDLLLPKVCEALVLVTQCVITITLDEEEGDDDEEDDADASMWVDNEGNELRTQFNEARSAAGEGLAESLLGLLLNFKFFPSRLLTTRQSFFDYWISSFLEFILENLCRRPLTISITKRLRTLQDFRI